MSKLSPSAEEAIYADYLTSGNYADTARRFGVAKSTVWQVAHRVGGDALDEHRRAARMDLCNAAWERVRELVGLTVPCNFVGAKGSVGSEAARAAADLARVANLLEPHVVGREQAQQPAVVHVFTGMRPPPELVHDGDEHADRVVGARSSTR